MNTARKILSPVCFLAAFSLLTVDSQAVIVDSGESTARDIFVNATVSAIAIGINLANVNVNIPSINSVAGSTALDGGSYSKTAGVNPTASVSSGLLKLDASVGVIDVSAESADIGLPGTNTTSGIASIANAGVGLTAGGLSLLSVDVTTPGTGVNVLNSYSEIVGDGVGVVSTATSNLLSTSGAVLNISVLGIPLGVSLAGLTANVTAVIPISLTVDVPLVSRTVITGFVSLTPDAHSEIFNGVIGNAEATALAVDVDLSIQQNILGIVGPGLSLLTATVDASIDIAQTSVGVTAVPEPAAFMMTAVGGLICATRRRRSA